MPAVRQDGCGGYSAVEARGEGGGRAGIQRCPACRGDFGLSMHKAALKSGLTVAALLRIVSKMLELLTSDAVALRMARSHGQAPRPTRS